MWKILFTALTCITFLGKGFAAGYAGPILPSHDEYLGPFEVTYVFDGDTVKLDNDERVRLLGLNTPEVARRDKPGQAGGDEARLYLSQWLAGTKVRLIDEEEKRDRYGRLLAHLFTLDGINVNARLIEKGLAHATFRPPNTRYAEHYAKLEREARERELGIWQLRQYQLAAVEQAWKYPNQFRRLEGKVTGLSTSRRYTRLQFGPHLTALIHHDDRERFIDVGKEPKDLIGKQLSVRGWVHKRNGPPFMRLYHPLQIERIEEE